MTEQQWLISINPREMVEFVLGASVEVRTRWQGPREARRFAVSARKLRLLACACCDKVLDLLPSNADRRLLALAEQLADGQVEESEAAARRDRAEREWQRFREGYAEGDFELWTIGEAREAVLLAVRGGPAIATVFDHVVRAFSPLSSTAIERERAEMADLVREVLGDPFRHEEMRDEWRAADGGAVVHLAGTIYDERAYHDLPVLADALLDAGCNNERLIDHCRAGGLHVRGCWALDRVLARE